MSNAVEGHTFDMHQFTQLKNYKERNAYAKQSGLLMLGAGIARTAYALSPTKVLKVATDATQSQTENAAFEKYGKDLVPVIYEHDPNFAWMIVERTQTFPTEEAFTSATGLTENWLIHYGDFLKSQHSRLSPQQEFNHFEKRKSVDVDDVTPTKLGMNLIEKFTFLSKEGIDDIDRFDHWGITPDKRLVCIDAGSTHGD